MKNRAKPSEMYEVLKPGYLHLSRVNKHTQVFSLVSDFPVVTVRFGSETQQKWTRDSAGKLTGPVY